MDPNYFYTFVCICRSVIFLIITVSHHAFGSNNCKIYGHFSENGIKGSISIEETSNGLVTIVSSVTAENFDKKNASWQLRQFPVDYSLLQNRCTENHLGLTTVDLNAMFGPLPLNEDKTFSVSANVLSITGSEGIWYSSLVIEADDKITCSTLIFSDDVEYKAAKVKFFGPIYGSIHFFWIGITGSTIDSVIISDIQHVHKGIPITSEHKWGIFATDSLDAVHDKFEFQCNALQSSVSGLNDLSNKLGKLKSGSRLLLRDPSLLLVDLNQKQHSYYLILYNDIREDNFLVCGQIILSPAITLKSLFETDGVTSKITLYQKSNYEPTTVSVSIIGNRKNLGGLRIHELPPKPSSILNRAKNFCTDVKDVYNPSNKKITYEAPVPGSTTQDMYAVGDLSGKINYGDGQKYFDSFLPLTGKFSVTHRSIVLYRNAGDEEELWTCGTLLPFLNPDIDQKLPMASAEAVIRYPLAGRIFFRQLSDNIYSDTVIIVESLVYSDGSQLTDTLYHNWTINENPPSADYYGWQNRCISAGSVYNPYKISNTANNGFLSSFNFADLSSIVGTLSIAGEKSRSSEVSRTLFTHPNLHLSHSYSIIGKSLVIYDENGPKARGNRLACSKILSINRRKAVARDWFGNGNTASIMGKIEMYQYSEYDSVDVEVDIEALDKNHEYHIHTVPVDEELEFPCENCKDIWNPFNVTGSSSGTRADTNTLDRFKVGDLSSKFGLLDNLSFLNSVYNDSTITLFGPLSIIGKSLVITQAQNNRRWACANIERGYASKEARELRAIASFHHPLGFAYGYIRMTQLIHNDGSRSDTVIDVNLQYPGEHNRNVSHDHLWMIYVNPVSVDATVNAKHTRCTAGGYVWNPYFTQLAAPVNDKLYFKECGPDNPLRCYHGDVSRRLNTISIGANREVFSDPYLALEGDGSIIGRSVVILDKNFGNDRFACANIGPDKDIIKYANIQKSPNFVPSAFLSDVREALGIPEWMLTIDSRKTKILHNGMCVQMLFHFKGPEANKIELDFSNLLRTGHLSAPSIFIPGYIPAETKKRDLFNYINCPTREAGPKKRFPDSGQSSVCYSSSFITLLTIVAVKTIFIC